MAPDPDLAASVDELKRELATTRRDTDRLLSALYDFQLDPPAPVTGKDASYRQLVRRIRELVRTSLPREATISVVTKGDESLLDLYGRDASHFPQAPDGRYGGYYPKRGLSAVAHLEAVRAQGADYLLLPATALWWLDHYEELRRHLERRYARVVDEPDTCLVYSLRERPTLEERPLAELEELVDELAGLRGDELTILDWDFPLPLPAELHEHIVFAPPPGDGDIPYLDSSVDIVLAPNEPDRLAAARRVASVAVATASVSEPTVAVERTGGQDPLLPSISIVIPCHDGAELTEVCLSSLLETLPRSFDGEILVVDDASSDLTAELLEATRRLDGRVRALRNRENLGFLGSCNRGAEEARGEYLLFLNNDTILLPGWLPPLVRIYHDYPDAGAVGGRLLYADGRLQEAGCLVFSDGSAAKFGYGDPDADAPLYGYVREVDYVSGALLLTPQRLFDDLGGLDPRYGFGFYDDDDYCFAVRAAGRRVYYQPESVIVHVEGGSTGTDVLAGPKRFQVTNQRIFKEKWRDALARQPQRPDVPVLGAGRS